MKKFFTLFTLCLLAIGASGRVVVFDPTEDLGNQPYVAGSNYIEKEGVRLTFSNGLANGIQYRLYKGQTLTVECLTGVITDIVFDCTAMDDSQYGPGCLQPQGGIYSYGGNQGYWTGESPSIMFTAVTNQVRFTKITVTVIDGGLSTPKIQPASGTYYAPIEVSISCSIPGAAIHYTLDGSTPTTASAQYTAPFVLSSSTTIKAISSLEGEVSEVACTTYEFVTPTTVENIAAFQEADDDETMIFNHPVSVLAQNNNYLFVKDETGYAQFYGQCGQTYVNGDIIPAGFGGTKTTYSCEPELKNLFGFKPAIGNHPIEPEAITAAQVGHETFGHLVLLQGVVFNREGNNYWVEDDEGNQVPVYFNTMGVTPPAYLDGVYNIIAIVHSYGRNGDCIYQLLPIKIWIPNPPVTLCEMINAVEDNSIITSYTETQVIIQSGSYMYFKQGMDCYGLIYGNTGQTYKQGDIIPPGWSAKKTTYNDEPELIAPLTGFMPATSNEPVIAEEAGPLDVNHEHWAHYLVMNDVTVTKMSGYYILITDREGNSCKGYLRFIDDIEDGHYNYLWGIVGSYRGDSEFLVTDYDPHSAPPPTNCFDDLRGLPDGSIVHFDTPLTAVFQCNRDLYVADSCGGLMLMYGDIGLSLSNGDLIQGYAKIASYQGIQILVPVRDWEKVGNTVPVEPEPVPIEELSIDMAYYYLYFEDVHIGTDEDGNTYLEDETGRLLLYDKYNIPVETPHNPYDVDWDGEINIADINAIIYAIIYGVPNYNSLNWSPQDFNPNLTYDVWGFLSIYNGTLEFYPSRIVKHYDGWIWPPITPHLPLDVNGDGDINIADVNALVDFILKYY